jgi:flagellar motility protein MotE (MotC chaperone)
MRILREFRLLPVVLLATVSLLGLKILGLVLDGGFALTDFNDGDPRGQVVRAGVPGGGRLSSDNAIAINQRPKIAWARDMFNFPDVTGSVDSEKQNAEKRAAGQSADTAGQSKPVGDGAGPPNKPASPKPADARSADPKPVDAKPADAKPSDAKPAEAKPGEAKATDPKGPPSSSGGAVIPLSPNGLPSAGERAVLERLGERRQELDARARELEIRESLVKSAEKRLDSRANEIKGLESELSGSSKKKAENEAAQLKGLVAMYENMKPRDAAKIFNRLEMPVLIAVVSQINPRIMADIMAQMQPEVAQRLTVELASRAIGTTAAAPAAELPKIEGQPR